MLKVSQKVYPSPTNIVFVMSVTYLSTVMFWAAYSLVVKLHELDPQGQWLNPWCGHDKIYTGCWTLEQGP